MTALKRIFKDRSGFSTPLAIVIVLALIMITTAISEYMRLNLIAQGVRDALQSAVISTVNDNYDNVYHGVREGYAGAYQPAGGNFNESIDYGDVYNRLDSLLGLRSSGGYHIKTLGDGNTEIKLSGLSIHVENVPAAPSNSANVQKFKATAVIRLEVPVSFGGEILPPMVINLKVQAGWIEKF